jgi:ATP-binding cassette subfamily B protein
LSSVGDFYENNLYLSNLHEFLALEPKITAPSRPKAIPARLREGIAFHGVKFQYPNSEVKILDSINLVIRPGEHIALVGENGCGKTTLVKLLCRLYDPTEGAITLDRIDVRELSLGALRRKISIVFQDYARYHLTAKENIWFGNIELPPEEKSIVKAARQAGAHQAIAKLREGYDTMLGKWFENGSELSVGEWQKVALARAFLRDSEILILDEPTSAMDAKAEYELFKRFHELAKGRTAILISHRLSTVKMADRIYFLENGAIAEKGTHDELIHSRGKYAYMFERQAENYR